MTLEWESRAAFTAWLEENLERVTPELLAAYGAGVFERDGTVAGSPAESIRRAREGLLGRLSPAWLGLADVPVVLLLATKPPHVDQSREHLPRFQSAVPHADVRWVDGAGHDLIDYVGPPLGDEIAAWVTAATDAGRPARSG